jgi:hypothetical protein
MVRHGSPFPLFGLCLLIERRNPEKPFLSQRVTRLHKRERGKVESVAGKRISIGV